MCFHKFRCSVALWVKIPHFWCKSWRRMFCSCRRLTLSLFISRSSWLLDNFYLLLRDLASRAIEIIGRKNKITSGSRSWVFDTWLIFCIGEAQHTARIFVSDIDMFWAETRCTVFGSWLYENLLLLLLLLSTGSSSIVSYQVLVRFFMKIILGLCNGHSRDWLGRVSLLFSFFCPLCVIG